MLTISGLKKFYFVPDINDMRCGAHRLLQIVKHKHHLQTDSTCTFVNLQFPFFSVPIWSGRMFMHSITLIIALIARLFSFSEKKLLKSEIIVVPLLTALMFEFYFLAIVKLFIFSELTKHRGHFYSYFMLNCAGAPSLAKL